MEKLRTRCLAFLFAAMLLNEGSARAQSVSNVVRHQDGSYKAGWKITDPFKAEVFIENKGQFDVADAKPMQHVLYGIINGELKVYFTPTSLTYHVTNYQLHPDYKHDPHEVFEEIERHIRKHGKQDESLSKYFDNRTAWVTVEWVGSNPAAQIVVSEKVPDTYGYNIKNGTRQGIPVAASAYKKLTYKNIYPNIDIEYYFPAEPQKELGVKYNIVVHPGGNLSNVKMKYSGMESISLDEGGNIVAAIPDGRITDHAPGFSYVGIEENQVAARFVLQGNVVAFRVPEYDRSRTLVIDPFTSVWSVNPGFTTFNGGYTLRVDYNQNVYVMGGGVSTGGIIPGYNYQVKKFSPAGVLQWTAVSAASNMGLYGDMVVLRNGTAISGHGFGSGNTGYMMNPATGAVTTVGVANVNEFGWRFSYNLTLDDNRLWFGAGSNNGEHLARTNSTLGAATRWNPWLGASTNANTEDIVYLTQDVAGQFVYITNVTNSNPNNSARAPRMVKVSTANPGTALWEVPEPSAGTMMEGGQGSFINGGAASMLRGWSTGLNGMVTCGNYVYTYDGGTIRAHNVSNGAIAYTVTTGGAFDKYSGLDVDSCCMVYAGVNGVVKRYSPTLVFNAQFNVTNDVYDLRFDPLDDNVLFVTGKNFVQRLERDVCPTCINATKTDVAGCTLGTGDVTVTDPAATTPFIYLWSNGATTKTISGLQPGMYIVTVTDNGNPCPLQWIDTINVTGTYVCGPDVTVTATPDRLCVGACTNIQANAAGGATPYTYAWSPNIGTTAGPLNVCPTVSTTYRVTVTDNNGDSDTASVQVTVNSPPTLTTMTVNPTCNGLCDGSATVTATGSSPFTYLWDNAASSQTTATATGLCVGSYNVTVTDANGCSSTNSVTLTAPPAMTLTTSKVDLLCNGVCDGSATVTASGGTTPYTYNWSAGGSSSTQTGLCAGTHTVTVTDANGCTNTALVTITEPPVLSVTTSAINASCNGACDGSATVTASGGTTPYTYNWSAGGSGSTQTGLCAGTYTVTVTDANGCISTASVTITQPPAIVLSTSSLDADCGVQNGSATVTATGGTGGFTYTWNDASSQTSATATGVGVGSYTVTVTDANGCTADTTVIVNEVGGFPVTISKTDVTCNGACDGTATATPTGGNSPYTYQWGAGAGNQTTQTATGLCPGAYGVTMTDNTGCSGSQIVTITEPPALSATETHVNVTCNGGSDGSIDVTVTGGTPSYIYLWDNGVTTEDLLNLTTSNFQLTVTDANNCTAVISVTITEPTAIVLSTSSTQATCNQCNGSATVTVTSGGTAPFTYLWDNAATSQTTATAGSLCAGAYTVTATDAAGCTETITANVSNVGAPTAGITAVTNATCNALCNGTATVTATGGQTPYTYSWNDANSQTTATASGLCAGAYSTCITDGLGCIACDDTVITEPTAIALTTTGTDESCSQSNGSATVTATGGTGAYTYNWSPSGQATATATGLAAGSHCVTVTDANGCTNNVCETIINIPGPVAVLSGANVCIGAPATLNDASTGTVAACTWNFGDGGTSSTCGNQSHTYGSAGTYTVRLCVADAGGCQDCDSLTVTVSPEPVVCFTDTTVGCVPLTATFADCSTGGATYAWNFGDNSTSGQVSPTHVYNNPGCYDVSLTVTSAAGCTAGLTKSCYVSAQAVPKADFEADPWSTTVLRPQVNFIDKSVNADAWLWNFGDNTYDSVQNPTHIYADTGCYDVTLTLVNQYGCSDTSIKQICVKDIFTIYLPNAFSPNQDSRNEWFAPVYYGICEFEMYIFDRWGNLIYETTSLKGWDGTANGGTDIVQEDVYVWLVKAKDCAGKEINKTGHVAVIK